MSDETSGDGTPMPKIHRDDGLLPVSPPEPLFPVTSGLVTSENIAGGLSIGVATLLLLLYVIAIYFVI